MPRFVIHEHHARNLHWDLRLELGGVLRSWALPKIPPQQPKEKRLAIQVEDHKLEYISFEGHLEEGYGAGDVYIWDAGEFELKEEEKTKLVVEMNGKKLKGTYVLLVPGWQKKNGKQWLFMKVAGPSPTKDFGPVHQPRSAAQAKRVTGHGSASLKKTATRKAATKKKNAASSKKKAAKKK